ncbi:MAG: imidazolonepropionase [Lewinellaceae bacterium]|nr:imidazolonepropionase [Saprospiraceae bacterium]MCB9341593.1 imidazolonepropionase [Lewinellaceae bacterium]
MTTNLLIKNIKQLVGIESTVRNAPLKGTALSRLDVLENAYLLVEDGLFADFGNMENCPERAGQEVDADGRSVFPCWCDSHTHLVFAKSREEEWVDRIKGLGYEEIAHRGGGILNSARRLQETPEEVLFEQAMERLAEVRKFGTGLIEIKSGYGLTLESELKMLRVIRRLKEAIDLGIKATFLGAHSVPMEYRNGNRQGYIDLIINEMLPQISGEGLADYIDVFCEKVAFSVAESEQIIEAGARHGLKAKIHVNQFNCMGGIAAAVRHGAVSVDHLELVNEADVEALKEGETIATLLPSAAFFLNDPVPPARKLIDANLAVALATDFNPGTSPSARMPFVLSLACIQMKMLPEEAINAATLNGASALECSQEYGSIAKGKRANFFITKPMPSVAFLPYSFGSDLIDTVFINGKR